MHIHMHMHMCMHMCMSGGEAAYMHIICICTVHPPLRMTAFLTPSGSPTTSTRVRGQG